ncbi:MAG: hypothetical protein HY906_23280 [Deltaproteobacteria bacterium]|nr:hypothetical protein [Deltaproteobacteria bacterium]
MTQEEVVARVVEVLERSGLPYMIAGSFASNLHGRPRMTQDADIAVQAARLDWDYLERWADALGLRDPLERSYSDMLLKRSLE